MPIIVALQPQRALRARIDRIASTSSNAFHAVAHAFITRDTPPPKTHCGLPFVVEPAVGPASIHWILYVR